MDQNISMRLVTLAYEDKNATEIRFKHWVFDVNIRLQLFVFLQGLIKDLTTLPRLFSFKIASF